MTVILTITASGDNKNNQYTMCKADGGPDIRNGANCYKELDDEISTTGECAWGDIHGDNAGGGCDDYQVETDLSYATLSPFIGDRVELSWSIGDFDTWLSC